MAALTGSVAGVRVKAAAARAPRASKAACAPRASLERPAAAAAAAGASLALLLNAMPAQAALVDDLLAKTEANKELNNKKRLATSGANFARSRTVTDGTCAFPNNLIGCENVAEVGGVKYLSDDIKLECEGTESGKICPAKAAGSFPSFLGV